MSQPIYEIPVTPPGAADGSWSFGDPDRRQAAPLATPVVDAATTDTATTKVYSLDEFTSPGRRTCNGTAITLNLEVIITIYRF